EVKMWFLDWIVTKLSDASSFFYSIYLEAYYWVYPFNQIAPFFYQVSSLFFSLSQYFSYFNDWVDDVVSKVANILTYSNIYSYFKSYFDYAIGAWNWITNAWNIVTNIINSWWSSTQYIVKTWIDNAVQGLRYFGVQLETWLGNLQAAWDNFKCRIPSIDEILSWFSNWWGKILANIISWGALTSGEINTLIDSKLQDWLPFYDELANLIGDIKLFFTDPLQWLYDRAEEFFERFW
ncbi:unnamed protein product, partial [marine sediment metagenome]